MVFVGNRLEMYSGSHYRNLGDFFIGSICIYKWRFLFMLKNIILILLLISSVTFAEYQAKVDANVLNVRATKSASSKVISKLNKGDEITVYSCSNGFCEISLGNKKGYVSENFISFVETSKPKESPKVDKQSDNSGWLSRFVIAVILYLLIIVSFFKTIAGLFKFSIIAFLLYSLWGFLVYGSPFMGIIVFGFIASLILLIPIKFLGYVFGDQTASVDTEEERIQWRAEREQERNRKREERNMAEQKRMLYEQELKSRKEQELRAKQKRFIAEVFMQGSRAECRFMDGNGKIIPFYSLSVQADAVVGYTSTTVTVVHGHNQNTYQLSDCGSLKMISSRTRR